MNVVISENASIQIDKAAQWFFEQSPGLETKFLLDLDKAIKYIQKHPLQCQIRYKSVRIKLLKKFTFGIHYIIESKTVSILYVFHTSQNSDDWF